MKVLQIVIYESKDGMPNREISNEMVEISTELSVDEFKQQIRNERKLSKNISIDISYESCQDQ